MEILQKNVDFIILILSLTLGLGIVIYNIILIKKGQQTLNWIEVKGLISKSEMGILESISLESFQRCYRANIEYDFEVIGRNFHSKQAFLGDKIYSGKSKAKKTLEMFPLNHTVSVFVNPDNYNESVLIKGSGANRVLFIILGLVFVFIGVLIKTNFELIINVLKGLEK
jgi:hypothetical protein